MKRGKLYKRTVVWDRPIEPGEVFGEVDSVSYRHADDGKYYRHRFGPGVRLEALEDGSLRIGKPGSRVWSDL